ncbi:hypothetical protein GGR50DRAFT_686953 [Xylaria sp. CBS 124048]|nr:hypothetical protein GGR50DRAFT_686953 [Xylaria sp. CBS 124048]
MPTRPFVGQPRFFDAPPSPPWDGMSSTFKPSSPPNSRFPSPPVSDADYPVSGKPLARKRSLKRRFEEDDHNPSSLPGCQDLLFCDKYHGHSHAPVFPRTPSITPEPSEDGLDSCRSSCFMGQDVITEKLNSLRKIDNKCPLPPLEGIFEPLREIRCMPNGTSYGQFPNQAPRKQVIFQNDSYKPQEQDHSPPQGVKRRRKSGPPTAHCNIKYMVEELDYIRYQRVDLTQSWAQVEEKFKEKFPMVVFPKPREKSGLQGVNYRQNDCLPRLRNGRLQFMENGHVDYVCKKTREQGENKHLYTLVYLFPDRAMRYSWVSPADRQRAALLNVERQRQIAEARCNAMRRGTYVEELPPDSKCGCCPGKDRLRDTPKSKPGLMGFVHNPEAML